MKDIGEEKQCPYCGFHTDSPQLPPYLPLRTVVADRYLIGRLLDSNGDGATYIGWDLEKKVTVKVREFLPDALAARRPGELELQVLTGCEIAFRDCFQSFLELWRKLARMRGLSALVLVVDIVEDYGTAYAVSEYLDGITLRDYLLRSQTGYISWEQARALFMPVLSTLGTLHTAGIIHRGISPTTLIICKDGKMRISGFSIWQARTVKGDLTSQLFPGYAAIEQYGFEGQQGPWTDIYAFAATLYRSLIGSTPVEAVERATNDKLMIPGKFAEQLPAYVINALVNALQIMPEDRTRSVEQLRNEFSASPAAAAAGNNYISQLQQSHPEPDTASDKPVENPIRKKSSKGGIIAFAAGAAACVLIFTALWFTVIKDKIEPNPQQQTSTEQQGFFEKIKSMFSSDDSTTTTVPAEDDKLEVPNLIGRSYIDVKNLYVSKFEFAATFEYSSTVAQGLIISQTVSGGTMLQRGSKIDVVVSSGYEWVKLPDGLAGKTYAEVYAQLTALGFVCERQDIFNDGTKPVDTVSAVISEKMKNGEYRKDVKLDIMTYAEPATATSDASTTVVVAE
ncbi:MAG: PASTA domain-containing protein [Clostridiales bacterium]|nr:PASTA domain-containing protein [Clostridiales bacterium]